MLFVVTLERPLTWPGERPFNPFERRLSMDATTSISIREWVFEARDEAEVRRLYEEAVTQDLPEVRGYRLRSVAEWLDVKC